MRNITFIGQIDSTYGRGKDKKKRVQRNYLLGVGTGGVVGGAIGVRAAENRYAGDITRIFTSNKNPTFTNKNAIRKNLLKYKIGQGSKTADVVKQVFNTMRTRGGLIGAYRGAALGSAILGGSMLVKQLKNRKTIKIGGKTLIYNKPGD